MSHTVASSQHYLGSNPAKNTYPLTLVDWNYFTGATQSFFLSLVNSADATNKFQLGTDATGATLRASMLSGVTGGNSNQAFSASGSPVPPGNVWHCFIGAVASASSRLVGYDALVNEGTSPTGLFTPTGINRTIVIGRNGDFLFGHVLQQGPIAIYDGVLDPVQRAYLYGGGHPEAITNLLRFWKFLATELTGGIVTDQMGIENLTISGGQTAGSSDPSISTWMTGGTINNLSLVVGSNPVADLGAPFDVISSPFTCALYQLGAAVQVGLTTAAVGAASQLATLTALGALAHGDYVQIGVGGSPSQVLGVDVGSAKVLFATPKTWAINTPVFRIPATPFAPSGFTVTANVLHPSPAVTGNYTQCAVRASCNADSTRFSYSNLFSITVANAPSAFLARPRRRRRRVIVNTYVRR